MLAALVKTFEQHKDVQWGNSLTTLLYDAMDLGKNVDSREKGVEKTKIVLRMENLLEKPPEKKHRELYTFYKRICRERQNLFTFLFIEDVPPDNNASERAIRNVKVKQKISGQFKTGTAAQNFAKIRSVIDTTIKNGMNVLEALTLIAKLNPQKVTDQLRFFFLVASILSLSKVVLNQYLTEKPNTWFTHQSPFFMLRMELE
jgi:transposase